MYDKKRAMNNAASPLPVLAADAECIDTHCHLDMTDYHEDLEQVILSAQQSGVRRLITIGIDLSSSRKALALAKQHSNIFASIGIHPHEAASATPNTLAQLAQLVEIKKYKRPVAYGEIGLDYAKNRAPRDTQRAAFSRQLALARELDLPVIIHDRDAHEDTLNLIRQAGPLPRGGVMHCFSGDVRLAREVINLGFLISIPGVVTFGKAEMLHEVARSIELEHILLETDAPFLAPVPFRGKRNEPKLLLYTAQKVANLKNCSLEEVARASTENAIRLFRLDQTGDWT